MTLSLAIPLNNVTTAVGPSGYRAGTGSLALAAGGGARFPPPAAGQWYRVTVVRASVAYSPLATLADLTIFKVTGVSGDLLTIDSAIEGTADRDYQAGDVVEVRVTGGTVGDIHAALAALAAITGDLSYVYVQTSPSASWTVDHNLGKRPSVTIVDSAGSVVLGDVTYLSDNAVRIDFAGGFSGRAYLN